MPNQLDINRVEAYWNDDMPLHYYIAVTPENVAYWHSKMMEEQAKFKAQDEYDRRLKHYDYLEAR
jgi:hypothetical protein